MATQRYPGPNEALLEAQARVCTGPHLSRPLGLKPEDPDPDRILRIVLDSAEGSLPWDRRASDAQMGAFLAAMTIRRRFPGKTGWSPAESAAFERHRDRLMATLDSALCFLLNPSRGLPGSHPDEAALASALSRVLAGEHLSYRDTRRACEAVLSGRVHDGLSAALLIGQRTDLTGRQRTVPDPHI